jgi:hypothetical protein
MVWFNVCLLMFVPQSLFDALLRPALDNPKVTAIQFILDQREAERWQTAVMPKLAASSNSGKVREPIWTELAESSSFILAENPEGMQEAHLSFWGEPFMSHTPGGNLPRYVFHVQPQSELIPRLADMIRQYHLSGRPRA